MKKKFKLIDLDCANCAAKMEAVSYTHLRAQETVTGLMKL